MGKLVWQTTSDQTHKALKGNSHLIATQASEHLNLDYRVYSLNLTGS